jgi:hypothetical protein
LDDDEDMISVDRADGTATASTSYGEYGINDSGVAVDPMISRCLTLWQAFINKQTFSEWMSAVSAARTDKELPNATEYGSLPGALHELLQDTDDLPLFASAPTGCRWRAYLLAVMEPRFRHAWQPLKNVARAGDVTIPVRSALLTCARDVQLAYDNYQQLLSSPVGPASRTRRRSARAGGPP